MTWVRDANGRLYFEYDLGISHNEQDAAAGQVSTASGNKIQINGKEYKAIKTISLTKETTICKRRVEDQTEMADHAIENPAVVTFDLELFEGEYDTLAQLNAKKTPFTLITHHGTFDNMIIAKLSDSTSQDSTETTTASVTIQEILIGSSITTKTSPAVKEAIGAPNAENTYDGNLAFKNLVVVGAPFLPFRSPSPEETARVYVDKCIPPAVTNRAQGMVAALNGRGT